MSKRDTFVCRFAVGDPSGRRSSIWRFWAGRKSPDLYIAARSVAGLVKASLHASGARHVALTSQFATRQRKKEEADRASRYFQQWNASVAIGQSCSLEFQVCLPTQHLRPFGEHDRSDSEVVWIPAAPPEHMIQVCVLFGPKTETVSWPGSKQAGTALVSQGRLSDAKRVWLVSRILPSAMFSNADYAQKHMASIAEDLAKQRIAPNETHRVVAIFQDDVGCRGFAEFAGDAFAQRAD